MADEHKAVIVPVSAGRWDDLCTVMESCSYGRKCWCAYWYLPNAQYKAGWGETNRETLERLVKDSSEPGLIAYVGTQPAAWVSVAPRENFDRLRRSTNFARLDDKDVWAVNCFVVAKPFRGQGLMTELAGAAAEFALARGADGAEAYPIEPGPKSGAGDLYLGTLSAFASAGYAEVARPLPRRPIMRRMRG
ncbi:MAG: GNAT family N-acetyltransferase [Gemmatimonadales bacterium]